MRPAIQWSPEHPDTRRALIASYRATTRCCVEGETMRIQAAAFAGALLSVAPTAARALLACPEGDGEFATRVRFYLEKVAREER